MPQSPIRFVCRVVLAASLACSAFAVPLDRSTIREVVNRVSIIDVATRKARPARLQEIFAAPNVLRTGTDSRAELVADDQTVTRVGSNTVFSFVPRSREIDLQKGSILFQSPSGKGGGSIRTRAASAAVLGTTIIVAATPEGAMKVLLVEGRGQVIVPGGEKRILRAGQMVVILPGRRFSEVLDFRLREQATQSLLIKGFRARLSSEPTIRREVREQQRRIEKGQLAPRGERPPPPEGMRPPPPPPPPPGGFPPPPGGGRAGPPPPPPPGFIANVRQAQKDGLPPPPPPPPPNGQRPPPPRR